MSETKDELGHRARQIAHSYHKWACHGGDPIGTDKRAHTALCDGLTAHLADALAASPADAGLLEEAMKVLESAAQKLRACHGTCSSYAGLGPIVRDIDALLARAKGATP